MSSSVERSSQNPLISLAPRLSTISHPNKCSKLENDEISGLERTICYICIIFYPTPNRRAHGDAAINEALRLQPNLPETHLAAAFHLSQCYHDYQKARVHLDIAEQTTPNSADALGLSAYIDAAQGHWDESTKALERAWKL